MIKIRNKILNYSRSVTNWKGWRLGYYLMLMFLGLYIFAIVTDVIDAVEGKLGALAEYCGWKCHSITNKIIYALFELLVLFLAFLIPLKLKNKYFYKLLIIIASLMLLIATRSEFTLHPNY